MSIDHPPLLTYGLVLFASLIAILVVGFAFAAAAKRGVTAVIALVLCTALGAVMLTGVTYLQDVSTQRAAVARAQAEAQAANLRELASMFVSQSKQAALSHESGRTQLPWEPAAEVASDEELAAIASAPPKIELEGTFREADAAVEATVKKAIDAKSGRPDWIDAHLGDSQKLITSGPFTTKESCEADTQKQLVEWLRSRHEHLVWPSGAAKFPGADVKLLIKSQHEELRDTSVGEMHILYTLAEVDPEFESQMAKSLAEAAAQVARKRGVRAMSFAGAGVLTLLAATHVVLKAPRCKSKNC